MHSRRFDGARALGARRATTLVAIGNFDGVHLGHRVVLEAAVRIARERGLMPVVLTFHPHPAEVLGRGTLPVLTTLERKVQLLCEFDPSIRVVVEPFTVELSKMSPRTFAEELLVEQLGARVVMVGENFRFGHGRAGDLRVLRELGKELGFEAHAEPLSGDSAGAFSSSRIRAAITEGDLATAERLLGRPHALTGIVESGQGRGRTIGVPTANLGGVAEALPPYGVYAGLVDLLDDDGSTRNLGFAAANIGDRPTVKGGFAVEAHLLGYDGDLYGKRLRLHVIERLREERRFAGLEELKAQIQIDVAAARDVLSRREPEH